MLTTPRKIRLGRAHEWQDALAGAPDALPHHRTVFVGLAEVARRSSRPVDPRRMRELRSPGGPPIDFVRNALEVCARGRDLDHAVELMSRIPEPSLQSTHRI